MIRRSLLLLYPLGGLYVWPRSAFEFVLDGALLEMCRSCPALNVCLVTADKNVVFQVCNRDQRFLFLSFIDDLAMSKF